jgi:hypothetical protein
MTAEFSQIGGVRIGPGLIAFNATWPFARFTVTNSELRLSCFFQDWTFPRASIRRLSRHEGISTGLRIEHTIKGYNPFIVFWTFKFAGLKKELEARGYDVS